MVATVVSASVFVVFTRLPSVFSPRLLPWFFALLVALFPVTFLLKGQLRMATGEGERDKLATLLVIEGERISLLGLYAELFMVIALQIQLKLASLMREKALKKAGTHTQMGRTSGLPPKMRLVQQRKASAAPTFSVKKLAAEGSKPAVGNVYTILCYIICLIFHFDFTGGSCYILLGPHLVAAQSGYRFVCWIWGPEKVFPSESSYLLVLNLDCLVQNMEGILTWGCWMGSGDWRSWGVLCCKKCCPSHP